MGGEDEESHEWVFEIGFKEPKLFKRAQKLLPYEWVVD